MFGSYFQSIGATHVYRPSTLVCFQPQRKIKQQIFKIKLTPWHLCQKYWFYLLLLYNFNLLSDYRNNNKWYLCDEITMFEISEQLDELTMFNVYRI